MLAPAPSFPVITQCHASAISTIGSQIRGAGWLSAQRRRMGGFSCRLLRGLDDGDDDGDGDVFPAYLFIFIAIAIAVGLR